MNCMLVGVYDRYILVDAGLMFPDFSDVGMQKILPDTAFIAQWKDKIEALVITHGHEDHIGAIPWILPALDPSTPVYASSFVGNLLRFRLKQFNLWQEDRFHVFEMNQPFKLGPFECEALRVTHSIPDCCGLIFRSSHGTILHTGDWKIDEDPVDGRIFDRETFEKLSKENVTLMMSDSTNVLTPGRSLSESVVRQSLIDKISSYKGEGRIVATLFASNLHRVGSLKMAADAAGRKLCFVGLSLGSYLSAAVQSHDAPFHPRELIDSSELDDIDPSKVMIVTTGSQAEPQAALSLASQNASSRLKLAPDDLIVYSAKVIPGNEKRVMRMMNRISRLGPKIEMRRTDNLHASGHGYREELAEVIKLVQPQHFLPVHGESVFLHSHAELAQELGIHRTSVIHDGEMLGVKSLRSRKTVSSGSMQLLGDVDLVHYFNDGHKGTGTYAEMDIYHRAKIGLNGIVIVSVDVQRPPQILEMLRSDRQEEMPEGLKARIKLTTRGIWTNKGKYVRDLFKIAQITISKCPIDASCVTIDRALTAALRKASRKYNQINPEIVVVVHEHDPRTAAALNASKVRRGEAEGSTRGAKSVERLSATAGKEAGSKKETDTPLRTTRRRSVSKEAAEPVLEVAEPSMEELLAESPNGIPSEEEASLSGEEKVEEKKKRGSKKTSTAKATVPGRKRGRPRKKPAMAEESTSTVTLVPVPEQVLEERREMNPRENPVPGADLEYG